MATTNFITRLHESYASFLEGSISGRYITLDMILPLIDRWSSKLQIEVLGSSVEQRPIHGIKIGNGNKRILMWSQMHGNESTTTRAIFDLINYLEKDQSSESVKEGLSLFIIPILNPDGAQAYTRHNANDIDLNRDAQALTQPESRVLRSAYDHFQPDFCFNLHGQRTVFGAGDAPNPASLSFLSPASDADYTLNEVRKKAMSVITCIHSDLNAIIPDMIGIYDDNFNINCVGDTFQSFNTPTVLFEAGHYPDDYSRAYVRRLMGLAMISALTNINNSRSDALDFQAYFDIPHNRESFYDVVVRSARLERNVVRDIGIQYIETLNNGQLEFVPVIKEVADRIHRFGHREIQADSFRVREQNDRPLSLESSIFELLINDKKFSLKLSKS